MILKIFSPKNSAKILAFYAQTFATFWQKMIITLVFEKNANFFAEYVLEKIAENCDHNIDPCLNGVSCADQSKSVGEITSCKNS
jgi:hypothetical protein